MKTQYKLSKLLLIKKDNQCNLIEFNQIAQLPFYRPKIEQLLISALIRVSTTH